MTTYESGPPEGTASGKAITGSERTESDDVAEAHRLCAVVFHEDGCCRAMCRQHGRSHSANSEPWIEVRHRYHRAVPDWLLGRSCASKAEFIAHVMRLPVDLVREILAEQVTE